LKVFSSKEKAEKYAQELEKSCDPDVYFVEFEERDLVWHSKKCKHEWYFEFDKPTSNDLHIVMKPVPLMAELVTEGSDKDGIVYDPFLGSGSTLIACEQTGRTCFGMEIDPGYIDVIIERWENFTGKKSKKITWSRILDTNRSLGKYDCKHCILYSQVEERNKIESLKSKSYCMILYGDTLSMIINGNDHHGRAGLSPLIMILTNL